jgi:hypothetical protein
MQDSHTSGRDDRSSADLGVLTLVPSATAGLPEWLAGRVDEHLAVFAAHLTQGLLAASTAVGLAVMAELLQVEVTKLAGPKASTTRRARPSDTAATRAPSPWAGGGFRSADRGPQRRHRRARAGAGVICHVHQHGPAR